MKKLIRIFLILLILHGFSCVYGQSFLLEIKATDSISGQALKRLNYKKKLIDATAAHMELQNTLNYFYDQGHLTASIDSLTKDSASMTAWLFVGDVYQTAIISPGNVDPDVLRMSRYKERLYSRRPFTYTDIKGLMEKMLVYAENNGYPFAIAGLDSITISADKFISASLMLELNQKVTIDSIIIKGNSKLNRKFIRNYFNLKPGDIYNESRVRRIEGKLQDLPFVSIIRPHEIVFIEDKASLVLYIDKKRASQFDGILGIAPNDQQTGKLLITGEIKLKLLSAFNRGELIDFNWRKLEAKSQDLRFHFNFPFLFSTPFGLDYSLHLFKKDTSYLTFTNNLGLQLMFGGYNHARAFYENQRSNLLSTAGLEYTTTLPEYADINTSLYGIGIDFYRLNYRYNPRRGYRIDLASAIGSKKIKKNANVNPAVYDSIPLNSTLYRLNVDAALFIPLFRSSTIMIANKSGFLENKNIFENELFRIGGLKTLRGFDEESITASAYSIFTLEFRYLFDVNSFFQLFLDGAFFERNANSGYYSDTPLGFGAGVNFETKAGIFSLSYALGSMQGQPIQFKSAKIHFGLTAKF